MNKHTQKDYYIAEFPFEQHLSIHALLELWKEYTDKGNKYDKKITGPIIKEAESIPELFADNVSLELIEKHYELVSSMLSVMISPFEKERIIWGAALPYKFKFFYATPEMERLFGEKGKNLGAQFFTKFNGENYYGPTLYLYGKILKKFYSTDLVFEVPNLTFKQYDEDLKIHRFFDIIPYQKYIDVIPKGELKKLSRKEINTIKENFYDLAIVMKLLPPENFLIRGFTINQVKESTQTQSVSSIKSKLLDKETFRTHKGFEDLKKRMQSLLKMHSLQIGMAAFNAEGINFRHYMHTWKSLLPDPMLVCSEYEGSIYHKAIERKMPFVAEDLREVEGKGAMEDSLIEAGFRSYIVYPLYHEDELVGALELGSPYVGALRMPVVVKLIEIIPVFEIAAFQQTLDLNNKVKAKIQEEFTSIHPVVEWKFIEAASRMINDDETKKEPIVFRDVHPLYGAIDVRSSSHQRNMAIINDLSNQLSMAESILGEANNIKTLPVFSQLNYQMDILKKRISKGLISGDESQIIDFFKREIGPVFDMLKTSVPKMKSKIEEYESNIDKDHGVLYKERDNFEISIQRINDTISSILDEQENEAQDMFPHYFEKYRTDGIEFSIYIGSSLVENLDFNPVYLKNLRLWQLITMCKIARKVELIKDELPVRLETTQLVLVHSNPLAIRFREDEKKFDVEGGYNIRYEITKKRIDKAVIKGTKERLTQTGTIAIIFSLIEEYHEYKTYLEYLVSNGFVEEEIEFHDLEDMQGLSGLKAIRVKIK